MHSFNALAKHAFFQGPLGGKNIIVAVLGTVFTSAMSNDEKYCLAAGKPSLSPKDQWQISGFGTSQQL